jgi:S-DNA-T family DNA segregation ATPase FtsK/SpoIIIE
VIVTEAKYVTADGVSEARRLSKQQLRQTMQRIDDALFGAPGRLDRDLWLSRIADLLLDGSTAMGQAMVLEAVRDGIRRGTVAIDLRGYSHVFVSGPADDSPAGEQEPIPDIGHGLQEVFGRDDVRALLKAYEARAALDVSREGLGSERPWTIVDLNFPAPRVSWIASVAAGTHILPTLPEITHPAIDGSTDAVDFPVPPPLPIPTPPTAALTTAQSASEPAGSIFDALVAANAEKEARTSATVETWLAETAQKLRTALLGYGFQAKISGTRLTPNAALIRLIGSDRLRLEDIQNKASSLLTTHGLRVISVSPLPGEIVVAVARSERQKVSLWDVWAKRSLNRNASGLNTSFVLGLRELDGELLYLNLGSAFGGAQQHEPHTLVAGSTGSGKSVLIQGLILDIAATNPSRLAHIYLIDPKMGVDYAAFERLPHLKGGIVIDQGHALQVMETMVTEMDRRYELFRAAGVRDLQSFNVKADPATRLPMVWLVHDEFAEWMLTEDYKSAVTANVQRLGVKARAAGIHLIFAAQRPDVNVMPIQLRDNLGNRLILKVASAGTSEIALGVRGAEALLGLGHLAAKLNGESDIVFAQGAFLSDEDIERAIDAIIADDDTATLEDQASV